MAGNVDSTRLLASAREELRSAESTLRRVRDIARELVERSDLPEEAIGHVEEARSKLLLALLEVYEAEGL